MFDKKKIYFLILKTYQYILQYNLVRKNKEQKNTYGKNVYQTRFNEIFVDLSSMIFFVVFEIHRLHKGDLKCRFEDLEILQIIKKKRGT